MTQAEDQEGPKAKGFDYDDAWGMRLALVRQKLADGPCQARQLLAALRRQHRHFNLGTRRDGPPAWLRKTPSPGAPLWPDGSEQARMTSIKGQVLPVPSYARFRIEEFLGDCALRFGPFDAIVELGCGPGTHLFTLYDELADPRVRYIGGELALSGIELARLIASHHEAGERFAFMPFDHTKPDLSIVGDARRIMVFTAHSIEQVHRLPGDYFHRLAAAAPEVVGIHIEPFGFQVNASLGPATRHQARAFATRRWNANLHHVLRRAEADGILAVDYVDLECLLPEDAHNPSSIAVWHRT